MAYSGWTEDAGLFSRLLPIGALPTVNTMLNEKQEPLLVAVTALAIWGGLSVVFWASAWLVRSGVHSPQSTAAMGLAVRGGLFCCSVQLCL